MAADMTVDVAFDIDESGLRSASSTIEVAGADAVEMLFMPLNVAYRFDEVRALVDKPHGEQFHMNETEIESDGAGGLLIGPPGYIGSTSRVRLPALLVAQLFRDWEQLDRDGVAFTRTYAATRSRVVRIRF